MQMPSIYTVVNLLIPVSFLLLGAMMRSASEKEVKLCHWFLGLELMTAVFVAAASGTLEQVIRESQYSDAAIQIDNQFKGKVIPNEKQDLKERFFARGKSTRKGLILSIVFMVVGIFGVMFATLVHQNCGPSGETRAKRIWLIGLTIAGLILLASFLHIKGVDPEPLIY
jgi:hypothetical protein